MGNIFTEFHGRSVRKELSLILVLGLMVPFIRGISDLRETMNHLEEDGYMVKSRKHEGKYVINVKYRKTIQSLYSIN